MSAGYQMTQSLHALADFTQQYPQQTKEWAETSNSLVVLSVKDENELTQFIHKLSQFNIKYSAFREPDIDNQLTAIAIEPCDAARKLCSNFPLALKEFSSNGLNKNNFIKI